MDIAPTNIFKDVNEEVQGILKKEIRAEGGVTSRFYEVFDRIIKNHAGELFQKIKGKYSDSDYAIGFGFDWANV